MDMGNSNFRIKESMTVHHIVNRIAHRVFFLQDDERNDFVAMMHRVAEFSGIKLIGWCVMTNHFHILAFLPAKQDIDEAEVIRRVGILKGQNFAGLLESKIAKLRTKGQSGEDEITRILDSYKRRMYDVGSFMKTLKQWFTEEYNRRSSHVGTLWETSYIDKSVKWTKEQMSKVLAYICLNPIRAGICPRFDDYEWSSLYSAARGDETAIAGLRLVYGDEMPIADMIDALHARMDAMLEQEKRDWALEVARRRKAGYAVPDNPLTDEAYVAQASAHLDEVLKAGTRLHEQEHSYQKCTDRRRELSAKIVRALKQQPTLTPKALAKTLPETEYKVYACIKELVGNGVLNRKHRNAPWTIMCEI